MINVVSLFGGIEAGREALKQMGIEVGNYYSSEIDKFAIKVVKHHHPDVQHLGDVARWREWPIDWSKIDLFMGGSPCQGFSFAGKQAGTQAKVSGKIVLVTTREKYLALKEMQVNGWDVVFMSQSHLFWEYVLCLDHAKAHNSNIKFLLENVKMKKELLEMIDNALGVKSVVINSALVSAQNRVRHYWANWEIAQPEDEGIYLRDILEDFVDTSFYYSEKSIAYMERGSAKWGQAGDRRADNYTQRDSDKKSFTLTANMHKGVPYNYLEVKLKKGEGPKILRPCIRIKDGNTGHIANATDIKGMDCIKRVYGQDGKAPTLTTSDGGHREPKVIVQKHRGKNNGGVHEEKSPTLTSNSWEQNNHVYEGLFYRKLTPTECARLQTFPDGYCESIVSNSQSYKLYGNSWTVKVIIHILKNLFDN